MLPVRIAKAPAFTAQVLAWPVWAGWDAIPPDSHPIGSWSRTHRAVTTPPWLGTGRHSHAPGAPGHIATRPGIDGRDSRLPAGSPARPPHEPGERHIRLAGAAAAEVAPGAANRLSGRSRPPITPTSHSKCRGRPTSGHGLVRHLREKRWTGCLVPDPTGRCHRAKVNFRRPVVVGYGSW
jgi:hypothetical protein